MWCYAARVLDAGDGGREHGVGGGEAAGRAVVRMGWRGAARVLDAGCSAVP